MADVYAFTGHRPNKLGGYGEPAIRTLNAFANQIVRRLVDPKTDRGISGMALGWDMAVANALHRSGYRWTAAIPFEGQASNWPTPSRDEHRRLCASAPDVQWVCGPGYAAWKMQRRNVWMVDECTKLIALWDGSDGGTANCVRYTQARGKPIINVWDEWVRFSAAV
jgi:uncharacterized phage-like protein YoqJ